MASERCGITLAPKSVLKISAREVGGSSIYLRLPPEIRAYLGGVEDGEQLAVVCEESKRYGRFIGVGKLRTDDAVDADMREETSEGEK